MMVGPHTSRRGAIGVVRPTLALLAGGCAMAGALLSLVTPACAPFGEESASALPPAGSSPDGGRAGDGGDGLVPQPGDRFCKPSRKLLACTDFDGASIRFEPFPEGDGRAIAWADVFVSPPRSLHGVIGPAGGRAQVRAVLPTSLPALSIRLQIYLTAPTDRPVRLLTLEGKSGNRFSLAVDGNAIIASNEQPQEDGGVTITREDAKLAAPSGWSAVRFDAVQLDAIPNLYLSSDLEDQGARFATTIGRVGTVDYVMVGPETTTAGGPVDVSIDDVAVYER